MAINILKESDIVKTAVSVAPSMNSLNQKLQWLLEVEKAYIDNQKENAHSKPENSTDVVEKNGDEQRIKLSTDSKDKVDDSARVKINFTKNEAAHHMQTNNTAAVHSTSPNKSEYKNTEALPTSRAVDLLEMLKSPLNTEKTNYTKSSNRASNASKEFTEVMTHFADAKMQDSVKLFTGNDGVQIVIKCEKSLSQTYSKMGNDIKHLLENRGNKVNSLIINGKTLWLSNNSGNIDQSEFNVIY